MISWSIEQYFANFQFQWVCTVQAQWVCTSTKVWTSKKTWKFRFWKYNVPFSHNELPKALEDTKLGSVLYAVLYAVL